ncbi:hypothetical protein DY245_43245 [Streptomyces inhibens]|uniref:GNAT family N-acetyltransferase n=1 Tax=Streptomyces inhibens TaxID=2293571 RepID=A0A371PPL6_STRIH|nr:hypothetical protein DY245_43245 [Streptomyces inhibens]
MRSTTNPVQRHGHPGEQAWILTMAGADAHRRHRVGHALVTEIARRAQDAGRAFLALVPQGGDDEADRRTFFRACGLVPIEPDGPGAAWGCPVAQTLAAEGVATTQGR